jgi:hypothetical protein
MPDSDGMRTATGGGMKAVAFGVAADLVYNIYSATNSSPQTTELFASDRSETLWKYVKLGGAQALVLVGIMAARGGVETGVWALAGGAMAALFMHLMYRHALSSGMENNVT